MSQDAIVLVGHGGVPSDFPHESLRRLKQLEGLRHRHGTAEMGDEEAELDRKIRSWPRTAQNDPYQVGLERLARHLRARLGDDTVLMTAYNEFCTPSIGDAIAQLADAGVQRITVLTTMFTPGGSHSEHEIPDILAACRKLHPKLSIHYAWPFDLSLVADFLCEQLRTSTSTGAATGAPANSKGATT